MSSNYSVSLLGPAPWGFRLQGGKDFNMPLTISRLTDLGKAAKARIAVGDVVLSIDGISTDGMNHLEAQNKIKACAGNLNLTLQRASTIPKPAVAPKPANHVTNGPQSILKATPPKRVPRRPILETDIEFYHVPSHGDASKKRLMEDTEDWRPRSGTTQSRSFRILAQITGTEHQQAQESDAENKTNSSPVQPLTHLSPVSAVQPLLFPKPVRYGNHTNLLYPNVLISVKSAAPFPLFYGCRRELLLNPLEFLPRGGPCPPALTPSAPTLAIRSHSTVIGLQARTPHRSPDGTVSQSLLDALLITPITTLPPLRLRKKKRRSVSALHLPNNKRVSWHQSVTDLGDPNLSSPVNAVYIFSEEVEEPETTSHMSSAVKTMTKGPAGSPNNSITFTTTQGELCSGFPKPGLQTCFGMRGNGTTSVLSKGPVPERPAPQPHPKDQDTLVQMAEHIPAGTRTPMCGHCNMDIRGPFLVAMGKSWHPEEFNCAHCRTSLADIGFVEEQGSVYCEHCYEDFFAPSCSRCQLKILGEVINALKQTWHIHCFLCASCQQPIRNNTFHLEDGEPYCERDYYSLFGTGCHGCEFPIEAGDKFLEALGFTWHDTCFVCVICCTTLEGQAFFSKMDKPLCRKHAHSVVKI
ncbi:PDZ and LIM domain protein 5a isoform X4 [Salmo salar]|uniref:PDZ and LIM domain protein 5a isoform X4 n=1 Tax=Salmo salar TaxID=8030 RepID=A0A1S3PK24_SALSA|nr:PDZ and LIM domain protein 5a isoform X4 [Salmo salar]|eukprot:XP_014027950.1 PREDICTED: PDZ and LIM domain protein 5 isoform X7 [Salmo salar]